MDRGTIPQSWLAYGRFILFHNLKELKASLLFAIKRHKLTQPCVLRMIYLWYIKLQDVIPKQSL